MVTLVICELLNVLKLFYSFKLFCNLYSRCMSEREWRDLGLCYVTSLERGHGLPWLIDETDAVTMQMYQQNMGDREDKFK